MKIKLLLALLCTGVAITTIDARCRRRRRTSVVAGFLGAVTGATLAATAYGDQCYYQDGPAYEFVYAESPRYIYSYPTYVYAPTYSYMHVRHNIYPSYYFRR